jgi:hypothetical protein
MPYADRGRNLIDCLIRPAQSERLARHGRIRIQPEVQGEWHWRAGIALPEFGANSAKKSNQAPGSSLKETSCP